MELAGAQHKKTASKTIGRLVEREKAKECLWANPTKGRSSIPGFGIPSD